MQLPILILPNPFPKVRLISRPSTFPLFCPSSCINHHNDPVGVSSVLLLLCPSSCINQGDQIDHIGVRIPAKCLAYSLSIILVNKDDKIDHVGMSGSSPSSMLTPPAA